MTSLPSLKRQVAGSIGRRDSRLVGAYGAVDPLVRGVAWAGVRQLSIHAKNQFLPLLSLDCLDPGSGRRIPAIWYSAGAYPVFFYPRNLVLKTR